MYSMVLLAAMTAGTDMPDFGRRGGGCCGCYGGMSMGYGGCYGMGRGGCYGMGYGGCYGGYRMGYGGCYGMGYGGWGGCYGMRSGGWGGCYGMGWGGYGMGYGRYVMSGVSPAIGSYASSPILSGYGTPFTGVSGAVVNPGVTQSFYSNPAVANEANEATLVVHVPEEASLTVDGQATQSRSGTRIFHSPPLDRGKTYTYALRAEMNRDGHFVNVKKTVEVRAGQRTEVTLNFNTPIRAEGASDRNVVPNDNSAEHVPPVPSRRTPPIETIPSEPSFPTPPRER